MTVQQDDPRLSRWTLSTHQFGRDWEFSWLARNLAPVKGQKIHWVSEPGSASLGLNIDNRGQIRFVKRGAAATAVALTISYEVPSALAPFASVRWWPFFCVLLLCQPKSASFASHLLDSLSHLPPQQPRHHKTNKQTKPNNHQTKRN